MRVSPAGARTAYGIMPSTAARPGYGMYGSNINDLAGDEGASRDFSRQYLTKMFDRTGSVPGALAAYNGGLGRGLAFQRGGSIPAETAAYVPSVINHYNQSGGAAGAQDQSAGSPDQPTDARARFDKLINQFNPIGTAEAAGGPLGAGVGSAPLNAPMTAADAAAPGMDMAKTAPGMALPMSALGMDLNQGMTTSDQPMPTPPASAPTNAPAEPTAQPPAGGGLPPEMARYLDAMSGKISPMQNIGEALMAVGTGLPGSGFQKGSQNLLEIAEKRRDMQLKMSMETYPKMMAYNALIAQGLTPERAMLQAFAPGSMGKWISQQQGTDNMGNPRFIEMNDLTGERRAMSAEDQSKLGLASSTNDIPESLGWARSHEGNYGQRSCLWRVSAAGSRRGYRSDARS